MESDRKNIKLMGKVRVKETRQVTEKESVHNKQRRGFKVKQQGCDRRKVGGKPQERKYQQQMSE